MKTKFLLLLAPFFMMSCEKGYEGEEEPYDKEGNIILRVTNLEMMPFDNIVSSRSEQTVDKLCTRLNFAVFSGEEKVKAINQDSDDADFGQVALKLSEGTYQLVVLAHSCSGNATISSPEKITFPNNKLTDTFFCYGELQVDGNSATHDLTLDRAVAMFRLKTTDNVPDNVNSLKFYYSGGSSTLDATTGYGCVNSRQTEYVSVTSDMKGNPGTFEVYTFPHNETDELKLTITALDISENTVCEKEFTNVVVQCNMITQYSGSFFGNPQTEDNFVFSANDEWADIFEETF